MIARVLGQLADAPGVDARPGLRAFRFLLLVHAVVRTWAWAPQSFFASLSVPYAIVLSGLALLALTRHAQRACLAALVLLAVEQISIFPGTPNHVYLEFFCLGMLSVLDVEDEREGQLLLVALRWMALVVLFYAGLQKVLLGYYFQGEFLLFAIAVRDSSADLFALLLPPSEVGRLRSAAQLGPGDGPFRTDSWRFVAAANLVWMFEMAVPFLLAWRRTRTWAVLASIAFVLTLQLAAREVMFALLLTQLLLLLPSGTWNERTRLPVLLAYLYILAFLAGLVPGDLFTRGGNL